MKKLMMALLVTATTTSVFAAGADMFTTHRCTSANSPLRLQLDQGGIANITQIKISRNGEKPTETYLLKPEAKSAKDKMKAGGPSVYRGKGLMSFSINLTSSPTAPRKATLVDSDGTVTQLLCVRQKSN